MKMEFIEEHMNDLMKNQSHILQAVKYLDERMKIVEDRNKQNLEINDIFDRQAKLDEIVVKSCDDILAIKQTKDKNSAAIKILDDKIDKMDRELQVIKKKIDDKEKAIMSKSEIKCNLCDKRFCKNSDLETHIKLEHENYNVFTCDKCDKFLCDKLETSKAHTTTY